MDQQKLEAAEQNLRSAGNSCMAIGCLIPLIGIVGLFLFFVVGGLIGSL